MTVFHIYDAEGRIIQSNKVYSPEGYADRARELGYERIIETQADRLANPDAEYAYNGELCARPILPVEARGLDLKAGGSDAAVFANIPPGCELLLSTGGMVFEQGPIPSSTIEYSPPVPATYEVTIRKWPYRDFTAVIRAT